MTRLSVSVIVIDNGEPSELASCLQSLGKQTFRDFEIVMVAASTESERAMRIAWAFRNLTADIVAITDSGSTFPADWLEKLAAAHHSEYLVLGGTVEYDGPGTASGWATYFADYGCFLPRAGRRETSLLAGNHVSYKKELLDASAPLLRDGYRKVFFHWDLAREGIRFFFDPDLNVRNSRRAGTWKFARAYFRNARDFARGRAARLSSTSLLIHILSAPLLPPWLLYRRFTPVWASRQHRPMLCKALPRLGLFVLSWGAGELAGYLAGWSVAARSKVSEEPAGSPASRSLPL